MLGRVSFESWIEWAGSRVVRLAKESTQSKSLKKKKEWEGGERKRVDRERRKERRVCIAGNLDISNLFGIAGVYLRTRKRVKRDLGTFGISGKLAPYPGGRTCLLWVKACCTASVTSILGSPSGIDHTQRVARSVHGCVDEAKSKQQYKPSKSKPGVGQGQQELGKSLT